MVVFFKRGPKRKRGEEKKKKGDAVAVLGVFRVRRLDFSLDLWKIRPSAVFGTRRKTALRGEGFTWVPDLKSLDKLLEVGVSPYLGLVFAYELC